VPAAEVWLSIPMKTVRPKKKGNPQSNTLSKAGPPRLLNAVLGESIRLTPLAIEKAIFADTVVPDPLGFRPLVIAVKLAGDVGQ